MRNGLSHPAEGLCCMQICLLTALLSHRISTGSCSMWPGKSAPSTSCWPVLLWANRIRGVSQDAAWHTQSEGEAAKVMHSLHQPPDPLFIHKFQQCSKQKQTNKERNKQNKNRTEWRQIQRVFWGLIFFLYLSSQERIVCSCPQLCF